MHVMWIANYNDGNSLRQFEGDKENRYQDIDRDKLERFDIINVDTGKAIYSVYLRDGQQLIYRRRTFKTIGKGTDFIVDTVVYLVGWKQTVLTQSGPRAITAINYIHEDGSIALDGHRDNLELLPFER